MMKLFSASAAAMVAGLIVTGSATKASAHETCGHCGPVAPVTHYKIVRPNIFKTQVHDVAVYKHVQRVRRITNVTEVQPVVHLHIVTRVHHHTIVSTRNEYHSVTKNLTPMSVVTRSTENLYECGCSP